MVPDRHRPPQAVVGAGCHLHRGEGWLPGARSLRWIVQGKPLYREAGTACRSPYPEPQVIICAMSRANDIYSGTHIKADGPVGAN